MHAAFAGCKVFYTARLGLQRPLFHVVKRVVVLLQGTGLAQQSGLVVFHLGAAGKRILLAERARDGGIYLIGAAGGAIFLVKLDRD